MKVAFYLDDFNPFHNGHLELIKSAIDNHNIDMVVVVPLMDCSWKHNKILGLYDRASIIALSIVDLVSTGDYNIRVSYADKDSIEPYSIYNTLNTLKACYNRDLYDLYLLCDPSIRGKISKQKDGKEVFKEWELIVEDFSDCYATSEEIVNLIKECKDITPYVSERAVNLIRRYYYYDV